MSGSISSHMMVLYIPTTSTRWPFFSLDGTRKNAERWLVIVATSWRVQEFFWIKHWSTMVCTLGLILYCVHVCVFKYLTRMYMCICVYVYMCICVYLYLLLLLLLLLLWWSSDPFNLLPTSVFIHRTEGLAFLSQRGYTPLLETKTRHNMNLTICHTSSQVDACYPGNHHSSWRRTVTFFPMATGHFRSATTLPLRHRTWWQRRLSWCEAKLVEVWRAFQLFKSHESGCLRSV